MGMTGSAVSWDVDAEMDGAGEREVSVGCEREGSNVRSREFRVGVARFALSSTRGFRGPLFRGGEGGWSSIGGRRGISCELRTTRDGGRGVLWSCVAASLSCVDDAVPGRLGRFSLSSAVMLFVRLCLLPTRLMRRIPPMNRRPPFSSSVGGLSGGAPGCASLEWSSWVSRVVAVELFLARCTSSTLADADRCFELARLLGVVGLRGFPSVYDTCRGTGGRVLQLDPDDEFVIETCIDVGRRGVPPPNSSVDVGTPLPSIAASRSCGSVSLWSVPSRVCALRALPLRSRDDGEPGSRSRPRSTPIRCSSRSTLRSCFRGASRPGGEPGP